MKSPQKTVYRRLGQLALVAAFGLISTFAAAQEGRSTVISMSPSGTSSLSWKRPAQAEPVAVPAAGTLRLTLPSESVQSEPIETADNSTGSVEAAKAAETVNESGKSPIRPVRLLQLSETKLESPVPASQPAKVAQDLGTVTPFPSAGPASPVAAAGKNEFDGVYTDECPDPKSLSSILELSYKVTPQPGLFPESCPLPDEYYVRKAPTPITFTWKASALCHKPLYFEDVQLERYGHSVCPIFQPAISGARFWLTIPILPYLMGTYPPNECVYDLGYYRPGSCAPHMLQPIPISLRGGLIQAGAIVGFFHIFP